MNKGIEFHKYKSMIEELRKDRRIGKVSSTDLCLELLDCVKDMPCRAYVLAEALYISCMRPFYRIYPAVVKCLQHTSLQIAPNQIVMPEAIAVLLPVGHEMKIEDGLLRSMIICSRHPGGEFMISYQYNKPADVEIHTGIALCNDSRALISSASELIDAKNKRILSLSVGISLLAKDERFAEPILLRRDAGRKLDAESLKRAIKRAKRNGVNGIDIGRCLDISPHVRRPHFGIRWTGEGKTVPRLVPIKGCVVSRDKLFPIPTGYLGDAED